VTDDSKTAESKLRDADAWAAAEKVGTYEWGFTTDIEQELAPKGLSEDTVRFISAKKNEPQWMLDWRLEAYNRFLTMTEPTWAKVHYPQIDLQDMYYYAAPKSSPAPKSLDEVDPALIAMYDKLGVPLKEREILAGVERPKVAVDAVMDSVSVVTTFREELAKVGIIFCSISEAIREHPELVQKYLASVVPVSTTIMPR
jgi:Fe-S cluster assembly protein SufB